MNLDLEQKTSFCRLEKASFENWKSKYDDLGARLLIAGQAFDEKAGAFLKRHKSLVMVSVVALMTLTLIEPSYALKTESLKKPPQDFKQEMFSGWMWGAKIIAGVVGAGFALAKQSFAPFGVGAGTATGIHFWDNYVGDGSSALI